MARQHDSNFFRKVFISSDTFDVTAKWNFNSIGIGLVVESNDSSDVVQYSFDGENVHGDLTPDSPTEAMIFDNRAQCQIWLKRETEGSPVLVRIEAWR